MTSREKILSAVKTNQPPLVPLPDISYLKQYILPNLDQFKEVLKMIGGEPVEVKSVQEIEAYIKTHFTGKRIFSAMDGLENIAEKATVDIIPHSLEDVGLAVVSGKFGVAENGSVWLTEDEMVVRALPFIAETLAIVISKNDIVNTMHEAYDKIGNANYGFGSFIAGPSKTADIEQSLVLGAHGPKWMIVFLLG